MSNAVFFAALVFLQAAPQEPPPRIAKLIERLSDADITRRDQAAEELRALGDASIPWLEAARASKDDDRRALARRLLRELSAPSVLIEDLRSDDMPGNGAAARTHLRRRYGPDVRDRLLAALGSDDDQQAIQAAFLLAVHRDAPAALAESPGILARTVRAMAQGRASGFRWVAAEAAVRLSATLAAETREEAWARALADIDPWDLHDCFSDVRQVAWSSGAPLPAALTRRYLRNLMYDDVPNNATRCRYVVRSAGPRLAPEVRQVLSGYDQQARGTAVELLLEWGENDLPIEALVEAISWSSRAQSRVATAGAGAVPPLVRSLDNHDPEVVLDAAAMLRQLEPGVHDAALARAYSRVLAGRSWRRERVAECLARLGPDAEAALETDLAVSDSMRALTSARGLLAISRKRHGLAVVTRAEAEIRTDGRRDNARLAAQLMLEVGDAAIPRLRTLLDAADDQIVVAAAAVLARLSRMDSLPPHSLEAVLRFAERAEEADEPGALAELLRWSEPTRVAVRRHLETRSRSALAALDVRLADNAVEPWLSRGR